MTVETTARKQQFTIASGTTDYDFTFRALVSAPTTDIKCNVTDASDVVTELVYTTDFTVTINSNGVGGTVTLVAPGDFDTETLTVYRSTTNKQESDYADFNQFPADTLELDLDRRTMLSQELLEDSSRTITLPISSTLSDIEMPLPGAGEYLRWNAAGTALETATVVGTVGDPITITVADGENNVAITVNQNDITNDPDAVDITNTGVGPGLKMIGAGNSIYIQEKADANADIAGYGQIWVNTATPNELYFTDDAGTDWLLNATAGATVALDNLASVAINESLISDTDNTDDLGSASKEWKDLFIDGTANIDSLVADTADIDAGTFDGVVGGTTPADGSFTTLSATGLLTLSAGINNSDGDIFNVTWVDYGATSTVVGWAATPTKIIWYKKVGNLVFVNFYITGTSDATGVTFTLPYSTTALGAGIAVLHPCAGVDNGTSLTGAIRAQIPQSSSTVTIYKDMAAGAWTNSGTKTVTGTFWYEAST